MNWLGFGHHDQTFKVQVHLNCKIGGKTSAFSENTILVILACNKK